MGFGGWSQGRMTWGEQDMAAIPSRQLQSWHIPPILGIDSDDPITQRLCMTCPPASLEPKGNWVGGGFFFLLSNHHNKQIETANKFPPNQCPNNCQRWQFGWFWYHTKRFFIKHFTFIFQSQVSQPVGQHPQDFFSVGKTSIKKQKHIMAKQQSII